MNDANRLEKGKAVRKVTWIGAIANLILSIGKVVTGVFFSSQALIADGIHSFSDLVSDGAILIGERYWSTKPDADHPYGHGRIETLVTLVIGVLLAGAALGICWRALSGMMEPREVMLGWPVLSAALASILIKEVLYRWTIAVGHRVRSRVLVANGWHHRTDALSSIPVAMAVIMSWVMPGVPHLDLIAAILVSAMLLKAAGNIVWPCLRELMDVQSGADVASLLEEIRKEEGFRDIREVHRVRTRQLGSTLIVDLHMLVTGGMTVKASHDLAEQVVERLKEANATIADVTVHVEPWEEERLQPKDPVRDEAPLP